MSLWRFRAPWQHQLLAIIWSGVLPVSPGITALQKKNKRGTGGYPACSQFHSHSGAAPKQLLARQYVRLLSSIFCRPSEWWLFQRAETRQRFHLPSLLYFWGLLLLLWLVPLAARWVARQPLKGNYTLRNQPTRTGNVQLRLKLSIFLQY